MINSPIDEIKQIFISENTLNFNEINEKFNNEKINIEEFDYKQLLKEYINSEEWESALNTIEKIISKEGLTKENINYKAKLLIKLGQIKKAHTFLDELFNNDKNDFYYFLKTKIYFYEGSYSKALEHIEKAIKYNEKKGLYWYWKGLILKNNNLFKDAIKSLLEALKFYQNYKVYYQLGIIYFEIKNYENAIKYLESILDSPKIPKKIYWYLGNSYQNIKNNEKAKYYFELFKT